MSGRLLSGQEEEFRKSLLKKWIRDLSPLDSRISVFTHIRDIPYAIIPEWKSADDTIRMMVMENKGWCGPKHRLLMWMFDQMGIKTEPVLIPFRWQDQPFRYPELIRQLLVLLPDSTHLCCKACLDNQWHIIDATWDSALINAGFPVNCRWDGMSDTIPAVSGFYHGEKNRLPITSPKAPFYQINFIKELNRWLEEVRLNQK